MKKFEEKFSYVWLLLGLVLVLFSYGIFNTGICAWIFMMLRAQTSSFRLFLWIKKVESWWI